MHARKDVNEKWAIVCTEEIQVQKMEGKKKKERKGEAGKRKWYRKVRRSKEKNPKTSTIMGRKKKAVRKEEKPLQRIYCSHLFVCFLSPLPEPLPR